MIKRGEIISITVDGVIEDYVVTGVTPTGDPSPNAFDVRLERIRVGEVIAPDAAEPGPWSRVADDKARVWTNIRGVWVDGDGVRMEWRFLLSNHGPVSRMPDLPPELATRHIRIRPGIARDRVVLAIRVVVAERRATVLFLMKRFDIDVDAANYLADILESWGVIGARASSLAPPVLLSAAEAEIVVHEIEGAIST